MQPILILYYSRNGATKNMAQKIAHGVESVQGMSALLRTVPSISAQCEAVEPEVPEAGDCYVQISDLENCSGLILGSPTRFGNMAAPLKYFIDTTSNSWLKGALENKPAACFTSSSSMHGGQESTLLTMMIPLLHHGMILTGLPYSESDLSSTQSGGTPYGASHVAGPSENTSLSDEEARLCKALGRRIAFLAMKLDSHS